MLLISHNTTIRVYGAWIRIYHVLCPKTYDTFGGLFWFPTDLRQANISVRICETRLFLHNMHGPYLSTGVTALTL